MYFSAVFAVLASVAAGVSAGSIAARNAGNIVLVHNRVHVTLGCDAHCLAGPATHGAGILHGRDVLGAFPTSERLRDADISRSYYSGREVFRLTPSAST
jgi:hypothetical protein